MIPFGKKIRVSNFTILKYTKAMRASELKKMRDSQNIPASVQKHLKRGGLPYIKVSDISENWSVEFVAGMMMYNFIDSCNINEDGTMDPMHQKSMHSLLVMMFADCTILGDAEYQKAKGDNIQAYVARQAAAKAKGEETAEEKAADDKILEEVQADEESKATLEKMAKEVQMKAQKGGKDGGK